MIFIYLIALFAVAIWQATVYQPIDDISIHQMVKYIYMYMHSTCKIQCYISFTCFLFLAKNTTITADISFAD